MYSTTGSTQDTPAHMGRIGEARFRRYADSRGIPYFRIDQHEDTMPAWLRSYGAGDGKRPDAVVATGEDVVLVEVKYRSRLNAWRREHFALDKRDAERLAETEGLLGKAVLLAYLDWKEQEGDWYGLLLGEALAIARLKESWFGPYYAIAKDEFEPLDTCVHAGAKPRRLF